MSASLSYSSLWGFVFNASALVIYISDSELEDNKCSHISIWPGFHFVSNSKSRHLLSAQNFLK